jgi:hypothetical protein
MISHDNVQLEDDRNLLAADDATDFACIPSRPEPVGAVKKVLLIDGREQFDRRLLHDLIL